MRQAPGHPVINMPLTVQKTASSGVLHPVFDDRRERSTHLVVLIDSAAQLSPWDSTFEQLVRQAAEVRSFASLDVLRMDLRSGAKVHLCREEGQAEVSIAQVARPGWDHLILVLSDGVGAAVSSGALGDALAELPPESQVAWLHPWPRRRWHRTRLGRLRTVLPSLTPRRLESPSILGVPIVPLSTAGLHSLERWVQGDSSGALLAQGIPGQMPIRRHPPQDLEKREPDWRARARQLAGALEPASMRLLMLAAAIPGRLDLDLLYSLGKAFGLSTTRYTLAEAMTAGFLERAGGADDRPVTLRFVSETASQSLLPHLDRREVQRVLEFLIAHYERGRTTESEQQYARENLQIPLDILTLALRPDAIDPPDEQGLRLDLGREGFTPMVRLLELIYPGFKPDQIEITTGGTHMESHATGPISLRTGNRKLIEVALPLDAINKASAREKSIRHGHPSTLHLWWARRPLAAARAVIFAQMVDDPSAHPDLFPTEKAQDKERQRLFRIIEDLVQWENTTNEKVLQQARDEIWQSWRYTCAANADHPRAKELFDRHKLPAFHDPFAGGGTIPLEAQRLGLESYASDLNPVAVLINKAMIEIPPKFAGNPPVNPDARRESAAFQEVMEGRAGAG